MQSFNRPRHAILELLQGERRVRSLDRKASSAEAIPFAFPQGDL